jgi:magnesium transporter
VTSSERAIHCVVYDHGASPKTLDNLDEISDILANRDRFVWLDIAAPTPADLTLLQREFDIHPTAIEDAALWHERPKIEFFETYVLVIAHGATLDAGGETLTHEIAILAGDHYAITLRASPAYPLDEVIRRRQAMTTVSHDATGLLYIILDTIVDGYFPVTGWCGWNRGSSTTRNSPNAPNGKSLPSSVRS